jgi:hypothetical protein
LLFAWHIPSQTHNDQPTWTIVMAESGFSMVKRTLFDFSSVSVSSYATNSKRLRL